MSFTDKNYCYYWIVMDFNSELTYGTNYYKMSADVEHLLQVCSDLKHDDKLYGIASDKEKFPTVFKQDSK